MTQSASSFRPSVTPTPSRTTSQSLRTPVGLVSLFGFETPIPYPFGAERTGYLVTDIDAAVAAARDAGAHVIVQPFSDPIGRDTIIEWPAGIMMQLYWHTAKPAYHAVETVPENRVYVSPDGADDFINGFVRFSGGSVVSDNRDAPGIEVGRPNDVFRRARVNSHFGKLAIYVTDGHLPYPYGRETIGYEVSDLPTTLDKAKAAGASVLVGPVNVSDRTSAMIEFPGGYVAEVHTPAKQ